MIAEHVPSASPQRRLSLGVSPLRMPVLAAIAAGIALGPHGIGLLSDSVVTAIEPAISMALAMLGALIGLEISVRAPIGRRVIGAALAESSLVAVSVAAGTLLVDTLAGTNAIGWLAALVLGLCAVPSSTPAGPSDAAPDMRPQIGVLKDVASIVIGAMAFAGAPPFRPLISLWLVVQSVAIAVTIAWAGLLLLAQTSEEREQRVFVIGTLLLLGGAAAYLSVSALLLGLVAGVVWAAAGSSPPEPIRRDIHDVRHPLVVVLLATAGARLELTVPLFGLIAVYAVLRTTGSLVSRRFSRLTSREPNPASPGIVGIAIALNLAQRHGAPTTVPTVLAVVVAGSLVLDLISAATDRVWSVA